MVKVFLLGAFLVCLSLSLQGITELTDQNFPQLVSKDNSFWLVLFAAEWCGHCKKLKPELVSVAPRLNKLGVKVGHVDEKTNQKLINLHVVDQKTHMVSYPKLKVFLGEEMLSEIPGSLRTGDQIYNWFVSEYNLSEQKEDTEL